MVYKEITVVPRRDGSCMGRRDRNITAFHPWFPADDAMPIDNDFTGSWPPLFGRLPLKHLIKSVVADPTRPFGKRMCLGVIRCGRAYKPEEFHVKLENGDLVVSARHERVSQDESGKDVQEMTRRMKVPDNLDAESIRCVLRENGDMVICANRQTEASNAGETESGSCANKDSNSINEEAVAPEVNATEETSERSSECLTEMKNDSSLSVVDDETSSLLSMDIPISGFKPSEVTVTCRGRNLTMFAEKTDESEHGTTYQKWRRQILLPPNVDLERLNCSLAEDGKLRLCSPKSASDQSNPPKEREVQI